jgi:hypothetical protein
VLELPEDLDGPELAEVLEVAELGAAELVPHPAAAVAIAPQDSTATAPRQPTGARQPARTRQPTGARQPAGMKFGIATSPRMRNAENLVKLCQVLLSKAGPLAACNGVAVEKPRELVLIAGSR